VQRSIFIAYDYLGFKRSKHGFFHQYNSENKQIVILTRKKAHMRIHVAQDAHEAVANTVPCAVVHRSCTMVHKASPHVRILAFLFGTPYLKYVIIQTCNFIHKLCHTHCYEVIAFIFAVRSKNMGTSKTTYSFCFQRDQNFVCVS